VTPHRAPARPNPVESLFLRRYYALFFIAHGSRRVWLASCTANPAGAWVTQQARNLGLDFSDQGVRSLIRDRDSKYSGPFDEVFRSEGIRIVKTPVKAPKANAIAERFVRTVRAECLDWLLILNRRHLEGVLRVYVDHYGWKSSCWTGGGSFARVLVGCG
jgi:putative transposase